MGEMVYPSWRNPAAYDFFMFLFRGLAQGGPDAGDGSVGEGAALSVTLVALAPNKPSVPVPFDLAPSLPAKLESSSVSRMFTAKEVSTKRSSSFGKADQNNSSSNSSHANEISANSIDGDLGQQDELTMSYHAVLRDAIMKKWSALTSRPFPSGCDLRLTLATDGVLRSTSANDCSLSDEDRLQLEAAALMAQPLPYAGYERVFIAEFALRL